MKLTSENRFLARQTLEQTREAAVLVLITALLEAYVKMLGESHPLKLFAPFATNKGQACGSLEGPRIAYFSMLPHVSECGNKPCRISRAPVPFR